METRTLFSTGRAWRYHVIGNSANTLVMLGGSLGAGTGTAAIVSEKLPAFRLIVMEYSPARSVAEFLDAFDAIVDQERIGRFAIYGGSFGGLLAQAWARRHPERITHLILSGAAVPDSRRTMSHRSSLLILRFTPLWLIHIVLHLLLRKMLPKTMSADMKRWKDEYRTLIAPLTKEDLKSRYLTAGDLDAIVRIRRRISRSPSAF